MTPMRVVSAILTAVGALTAVVGIVWVLTYYISGAYQMPFPNLGNGNIIGGLVFVFIGGVELVVSAILWRVGRSRTVA